MTAEVRRRLAAILSADIAGYSRLMADDEAATVAALKGHQAVVLPLVEAHGGRIQDTAGDGILAEFGSVVAAVACAADVQRVMAERNATLPPERHMFFRVGVNLGDVGHDGARMYGDGINVAARVQALAEPGGIVVTRSVRDEVRGKLSAVFEELGEHRLHNIARPVRVFRVRLDRVAAGVAASGTPGWARLARRLRWVSLGALIAVAAGLGLWLGVRPWPSPPPPRLSVAVLPFVNLGGDPEQEYVSDALTEDLTSDLSRIEGAFVIARNTTATYKGRAVDVKQVGQELGVRYVLEGSVRRADRQVRVNAQLIDVATGTHVWAERFDRTAEDLSSLQSDVTGRIARALHLELKAAESRRVARGRPESMQAADYVLRAWAELWSKQPTKQTNDQALAYLERARALDPDVAEIWTNLAYAHARAAASEWSAARAESLRLALEAGERAVRLGPKSADAHYAYSFALRSNGVLEPALREAEAVVALNPNHAPGHAQVGIMLLTLGRVKEAEPFFDTAFRLSPRDPLRAIWHAFKGRGRLLLGDDAAAVEEGQRSAAANPAYPTAHGLLASAYAHLGKDAEARAAAAEYRRLVPGVTLTRAREQLAPGSPEYARLMERYWSGLRKAGLPD